MYENIESETLSVENIFTDNQLQLAFFLKDSCDQMNGKVC